MAKLEIITGEDNPVLRAVSEPVKKFDAGLKKFVKEMREAMIGANGLGIAAPQVGVNERVFIVTLDYKKEGQRMLAMVNPEIVEHGVETETDEEGCLSLPGRYGKIARWNWIKVEFFDPEGAKQSLELEGLNARVVQHENDHLNGVLFIDRMKKGEMEQDLLM